MKEITDDYVNLSFDGNKQANIKFCQFKKNYKKYFPSNTESKVLDIGVGRGEMLTCMKNWKFDYYGVDISKSTISYCHSLDLKCEQVFDTPSWLKGNKGCYELITCLDVLEHVDREASVSFSAAIRESLSEDGRAIFQVPNLQSPFGYLHHFNDVTHRVGYVEHSLKQVLMAAGYSKLEFFGFEELCENNIKTYIRRLLRPILHVSIRVMRAINSNPNPKILHPVLSVIAYK